MGVWECKWKKSIIARYCKVFTKQFTSGNIYNYFFDDNKIIDKKSLLDYKPYNGGDELLKKEILKQVPSGWKVMKNANAPVGYKMVCNNISRFSDGYKTALVPADIAEKWVDEFENEVLHLKGTRKMFNDSIRAKIAENKDKIPETANEKFVYEYFKKSEDTKKRSKIYNILRSDMEFRLYNGGMSTDGFDTPIAYMCYLGSKDNYSSKFEIIHYSRTKKIEIYKSKYEGDIPNLHYYYYLSDGIQQIFKDDHRERLTQDDLCKLANKNWSTFPNFVKNPVNAAFLKQMKIKLINCLIHDKQIIYSKKENKYISYNFMEFCKENGYEW